MPVSCCYYLTYSFGFQISTLQAQTYIIIIIIIIIIIHLRERRGYETLLLCKRDVLDSNVRLQTSYHDRLCLFRYV